MMTVFSEISKSFNKQAAVYEQVALVQQEIGNRLFERLHYLKKSPKYILDLGCGSGVFSKKLRALYPKAEIVGLDCAQAMLLSARSKQRFRRKWSLVRADLRHLPFASGIFDLVFSNQVLHWAYPLDSVLRELNRVMHLEGCLMFSTLGPDTFKEIQSAWLGVNAFAHRNEFIDLHEVGDALVQECFLDPVVDMEVLTMHYGSMPQLLDALKQQGVKNVHVQRNKALTGKVAWQKFYENYESMRTPNGKYPLSYEVVYGHAWKGQQRATKGGVEVLIPVASLLDFGHTPS